MPSWVWTPATSQRLVVVSLHQTFSLKTRKFTDICFNAKPVFLLIETRSHEMLPTSNEAISCRMRLQDIKQKKNLKLTRAAFNKTWSQHIIASLKLKFEIITSISTVAVSVRHKCSRLTVNHSWSLKASQRPD